MKRKCVYYIKAQGAPAFTLTGYGAAREIEDRIRGVKDSRVRGVERKDKEKAQGAREKAKQKLIADS